MLRLRSDEQLVSLFRAGNDEAFRAIHDRYRSRMLGYTRQMLAGSPQDAEDAVQEIFVRAFAGLRANRRELALRAWLYRIAHNRCIDELRRPHPVALETIDSVVGALHDPVAKVEQRDSLRRLIADVRRLPEQQRSALLMREMGGMAYADVAGALGVSVPAVKSLLVRARMGLAQASEARDTACAEIREGLIASHDRGVRASGLARRHMRDCASCREFRAEVRGVSRRFAALTPTLGPIGVLANLLGWGGGGAAAGTSAVAGGGTAAAGSGAAASAGVLAGSAGHVVTLLAAAVVATGGAVEIQHTLTTPTVHRAHHHRVVATHQAQPATLPAPVSSAASSASSSSKHVATAVADADPAATAPAPAHTAAPARRRAPSSASAPVRPSSGASTHHTKAMPISETLDPDQMMYGPNTGAGASTTGSGTSGSASGTNATGSSTATGTDTGSGSASGTNGTAASGTTAPTTTTPSTTGTPGSTSGTGATGSGTGATSSGSGTPGSASGSSGSGAGATGGGFGAVSTSGGGASSTTGAGSLTFVQGQ